MAKSYHHPMSTCYPGRSELFDLCPIPKALVYILEHYHHNNRKLVLEVTFSAWNPRNKREDFSLALPQEALEHMNKARWHNGAVIACLLSYDFTFIIIG